MIRLNDILHMQYPNGSIQLPNLDLGLYRVQSFLIEFQAIPIPPRVPDEGGPSYTGQDPEPEETAYQSYQNFGEHQAYPQYGEPSGETQYRNHFIPGRQSFAGFDHQAPHTFRRGVHDALRTIVNNQNYQTGLMEQNQGWTQRTDQTLETIQESQDIQVDHLGRIVRRMRI
jgi:hypothetical protein